MAKKIAHTYIVPASAENNRVPSIFKYALITAILAICVYANTLQNGFALDDALAITTNTLVRKGTSAIPEILATPYHYGNSTLKDNLYRPLSLVMFAVEYELFPDNPFMGHLVNILLFAGCVLLFFYFIYHLFRKEKPLIAFIGALLFALHPIHTEVVANIKSRDELLCFFFGFLALNALLKYTRSNARWALAVGAFCYLLSLFSKETSITLVAVIPLIFFFFRNENKRRSIYILLFSLLAAAIYLVARHSVLTTYQIYATYKPTIYENALVIAPSFASRLATEFVVLGHYLRLLVVPYPLISDYSYNAIPFADLTSIEALLSLLTYLGLAALGVYRLAKKYRDPLTFGLLFYLITISIFTNILFLTGAEMAERFMFFPSAGFCLAGAYFIGHLADKTGPAGIATIKSKRVLFVLVPVTVLFAIITFSRNSEWKDDLTLYRADAQKSPNNFRLFYLAGNAELLLVQSNKNDVATQNQMLRDAIADFQRSIAIFPEYDKTHVNLALAFRAAGRLDSAEVHCRTVLELNPDNGNAIMTLANIYTAEKKYPDALALLKKMCVSYPANATYFCDAGVCNAYMRQYDSAIHYFRKAMILDPSNAQAVKFTALSYYSSGQMDSARKYEAAARLFDRNFSIERGNKQQ